MNRQYSQSIGRFNRTDPPLLKKRTTVPQNWDRYSYVENKPTDAVDPLGLCGCSPDQLFAIDDFIGWGDPNGLGTLAQLACMLAGGPLPGTGVSSYIECNECCGLAWDLCWDKFLEELNIITPGPRKAAYKCLKQCLSGTSGLNAGCMGSCLLDAQIAGQEAIVEAVNHWFQCMSSQVEICRRRVKDCWCDFG